MTGGFHTVFPRKESLTAGGARISPEAFHCAIARPNPTEGTGNPKGANE